MRLKTIGRYQIKRELGKGGMGAVYVAFDPKLEREVAIKLLPSYLAEDPEFSARFYREAKTIAGLDHYAIIPVHDSGQEGVWPYFVMRLLSGGSLKDRIAAGPMSLSECSKVVYRVGAALDKAHAQGVIHRDVKPGNILFDEDDQSYLGDFGLVRLAEGSENFTRTGNILGTPAYMSPEQVDDLPDIDGRTDVYSLGVVLYEMLTGQAPYAHESSARLMMMHLNAPIPDLLAARPDLPPSLQDVIDAVMAKDRDDRYATAAELADAVRISGGTWAWSAAKTTQAAGRNEPPTVGQAGSQDKDSDQRFSEAPEPIGYQTMYGKAGSQTDECDQQYSEAPEPHDYRSMYGEAGSQTEESDQRPTGAPEPAGYQTMYGDAPCRTQAGDRPTSRSPGPTDYQTMYGEAGFQTEDNNQPSMRSPAPNDYQTMYGQPGSKARNRGGPAVETPRPDAYQAMYGQAGAQGELRGQPAPDSVETQGGSGWKQALTIAFFLAVAAIIVVIALKACS